MGPHKFMRPFIHRDDLDEYMRLHPIIDRTDKENVRQILIITYTPIFTGVQSSFG